MYTLADGMPYYLYASVIPEADVSLKSIGRRGTQLILSYNTPYAVNATQPLSVVALQSGLLLT